MSWERVPLSERLGMNLEKAPVPARWNHLTESSAEVGTIDRRNTSRTWPPSDHPTVRQRVLEELCDKSRLAWEVEGADDKSRLAMFTAALQEGLLHTDLTTHSLDTFEETMVRAGSIPVMEVMSHAAQQGLMTYPTYTQKACNVEDTGKWCAYHRKNDHDTKDCYTLKNEMARLI
ncbi:hypothetical protein DM860_010340 [Cuscuta australis]|uniref:Uncharacterized protein n=1 Tax=Cuscuta australis TaxID=267555 RepID=A0A328D7M9_9ASTE|nr:hypothetical protein DM860_010340 [Cuscuta australis]